MNCLICEDRDIKCLSCYDLECGITNLQMSIAQLESELEKQKIKLRDVIEVEKPNRVKLLNEYYLTK